MTSIKEIPSRCFWNSFELDKILLPPSITKIVAGSFESLHKIRSLYIPTNVTAIEDKAFFDLPKLYILAYFVESNFANRGLFQNCSILQNVRVIPSYPSTLFGSVKVVRIAYLVGISELLCKSVCNKNNLASISIKFLALSLN